MAWIEVHHFSHHDWWVVRRWELDERRGYRVRSKYIPKSDYDWCDNVSIDEIEKRYFGKTLSAPKHTPDPVSA